MSISSDGQKCFDLKICYRFKTMSFFFVVNSVFMTVQLRYDFLVIYLNDKLLLW